MFRIFSFRLGWLFAATAVVVPVRQVTAALTREFDETYAVASERRLVVDADELELSVTAANREDIALHMVWNAETDDQETANERFERLAFEPTVGAESTVLKLEATKKHWGWFKWGGHGRLPKVRMELQVPANLSVLVDVTSGEVVMRGVAGNHRIDSTSADVVLENCAGNHRTDTTSGNVVLRGCSGHHRADTVSGDIRISGGFGDVVADTTSGNIRIIGFPGAHQADTVSGDIVASLGSVIDHNLRFDTVSGNVVIQVPTDLAAHYKLDTVSGGIRFDVPDAEILRKKRRELSARTLRGEQNIRLDTVSGNITVTTVAQN